MAEFSDFYSLNTWYNHMKAVQSLSNFEAPQILQQKIKIQPLLYSSIESKTIFPLYLNLALDSFIVGPRYTLHTPPAAVVVAAAAAFFCCHHQFISHHWRLLGVQLCNGALVPLLRTEKGNQYWIGSRQELSEERQ